MARPGRRATGGVVIDTRGKVSRYGIRFRDQHGRRRYESLGAVSEAEAYEALETRLAEVRIDKYRPPEPTPIVEEAREEQTFHEFASEWLASREAEGLKAKTLVDLHWSLEVHLLPYFAGYRLSEISRQLVDAYKVAKVAERAELEEQLASWEATEPGKRGVRPPRGLSKGSINHTLRHLAQILETAVEYDLIQSNPATGKRRRLKAEAPARPWVEPEQLIAFLESAPNDVGRVVLAILAGAGLRIGEALALRWRDVDLGTGTLYVRDAKTPKGIREVHLSHALRELLAVWRADTTHAGAGDFVVCTATGKRHNPSNLRRDVLAKTVEAANERLEAAGIAPIASLTFHGLRRTYASLRCVCGDDQRYTADQLGHEDPRFTLRCYAQASKRRDRMARPQREAFDAAIEWAAMGSSDALTVPELRMEATKNPA
jgi:integrase